MSDNQIKLNIIGMSCKGCAAIVKNALSTLPDVSEVVVDLSTGTATVTSSGNPPAVEKLIDTVRQAGYDAISLN